MLSTMSASVEAHTGAIPLSVNVHVAALSASAKIHGCVVLVNAKKQKSTSLHAEGT